MRLPRFMNHALAVLALVSATGARAQIVVYQDDDFGGRSVSSNTSLPNLAEQGFNDKASSVVVRTGRWQLCDDAFFRGRCVTLGPGSYRSLSAMDLNDRVSSVRDLGWTPDGAGGWTGQGGGQPHWGHAGGRWGQGARAVVFEHAGMAGRALVIEPAGNPDFARQGFNDLASSIRIESGYWLFCTDAHYEGECRTFGPGDHATLPGRFNDRFSSARRIAAEYPYRDQPRWRD